MINTELDFTENMRVWQRSQEFPTRLNSAIRLEYPICWYHYPKSDKICIRPLGHDDGIHGGIDATQS